MHLLMSFSHELKTSMVLAEYLPFSFCIFWFMDLSNSSALRWRLRDAMEASFSSFSPFATESLALPWPHCLCPFLMFHSQEFSTHQKTLAEGPKWGIDEIDPCLTTRLLKVTYAHGYFLWWMYLTPEVVETSHHYYDPSHFYLFSILWCSDMLHIHSAQVDTEYLIPQQGSMFLKLFLSYLGMATVSLGPQSPEAKHWEQLMSNWPLI